MIIQNKEQETSRLAFTLIEMLVVVSIIGILMGLSIFGLQGAREASRDSGRKADLELIRSGIEIYKSDCGNYPAAPLSWGNKLAGTGSPSECAKANTYISLIPQDPMDPKRIYSYTTTSDGGYTLCAALEKKPSSSNLTGCATCGTACNYKVTNP